MIWHRAILLTLPLLIAASLASSCSNPTTEIPMTTYPQTKRVDVVETHFGEPVTDPYRWLENDVRSDTEVAGWVESQNKVTNAYLGKLPGRDVFKNRLKQLFNYERFTMPVKNGSRYFYLRNSGSENQLVLYVRDTIDGAGRMLTDPNSWAKDGATALAEWSASNDGAHVAYAVQDGGTDWRTIKVLDVNTGKVLADELKWARFTSIAWAKDDSKDRLGFFYARFPEPKQGGAAQQNLGNHAIYFHALRTPQAQDRPVYATPDQPTMLHFLSVTGDGRYLSINSSDGSLIAMALTVVDLKSANWKPRKLFDDSSNLWGIVGNIGTKFFITTTKDAPRL